MIKIQNLTKKYKDTVAVDNLCLEVKEGELFSLLGVNGAGKTTTIKMLCCLTPATSGDAFLNGQSINTDTEKVKSIISLSPQETAVAGGLTVKENLEFICGIYNFSKTETEQKIKHLSKLLGLDVIARSELWDIIKELKGKITVILTTHYMQEAEALSDRVGIMKDGRLIACADVDGIKKLAATDSFEEAFISIVKEAGK